ncbi:pilus assembly protein [Kaarinaea lacus]
MYNYKSLAITIAASTILLMTAVSSVNADDTEIFTAHTSTSPNSNVVFVIDTSGSMGNAIEGDNSGTPKIQVVKDVFEKLIFDPNNPTDHSTINPSTQGLNFAIMRFDDGQNNNSNANGGYFLTRMRTLNNGSKSSFWDAVNGLTSGGYTPLAETAYEASLYFSGGAPRFGNSSSPAVNNAGILLGTGNYASPFRDVQNQTQCAINNHLVILTDGMPTRDGDADTEINALPGTTPDCVFSDAGNTDCLPQVAQYLFNKDFLPDTVDGVQNVRTHTIAFDLRDSANSSAVELLRQTAEVYGGGIAANANNATELADAITNIIAEVARSATSFVSPAVSIDNFSQYVHDNTVYFGLFQPEIAPQWTGNVKGYQVSSSGELMDFSDPPINAYTDTGDFSTSARSKWSAVVDGPNIDQGGAAARVQTQIATGQRNNIFTQNSAIPTTSTLVRFSVANETNLPAADFGASIPNDEKVEIIRWATSRNSNPLGAPLHSNPQVVSYGGDTGDVIFFGTNQGFLHAISADSGNEIMSFIPKSLLSNLKTFRDNITGQDHPYGLDGPITVYRKDANSNGVISPDDTGDIVLVIIGMRRGGNDYFALNVTDPDRPTLQWVIDGGEGDFAAMGQSWSKATMVSMIFDETTSPREDVLLLTGGYDTQYDELDNTISNPAGAAIYAVNLLSGSCEWIAANNPSSDTCARQTSVPFNHSIPSDVSAIHVNSDGVIDRLYVIDIMGYIFRIDLNNIVLQGDTSNYQPVGRLFADLSGGDRRYYYSVDVAHTRSGFTSKLHLSVGSGHRAHPLAPSEDIFASVLDVNFNTPLPDDFTPITLASLTNQTTLTPDAEITNGWYFTVPAGEKVLSMAAAQSGYVFFTTYAPPDAPDQPTCTPVLGSGNLYAVSLYNSAPLSNERAIPLTTTGIPPSPAFMTLSQPDDVNGEPGTLANLDTRRIVLVGGQNPLSDEDEDKLNQGDTSKTYWEIVN